LYARTVSSLGTSVEAAPALPAAAKMIAAIDKIVIAYLDMVIPPLINDVMVWFGRERPLIVE
jgi:hypothetical protein